MKSGSYIIENDFIKKSFAIKNDKIISWDILNKVSGRKIDSLDKSEEFIISFKSSFLGPSAIKCSEMKIESFNEKESASTKTYTIIFKTVKVKDSRLKITLIYDAPKYQGILRKHLEVKGEKVGEKPIILDYINLESMKFDSSLKCWCIPDQPSSHVPGYMLEMGQPLYIDSLFMGSEFPAALNKISDFTTSVNCYSGRDLRTLIKDKPYVSYNSVIGAAEGNIFEQVQKAFFEYIRSISKPVKLRRQYNSWYDHMLNITRSNIYSSFLEIEKALTRVGERPLDSFVVDDGWNDYSKDFWCFNEKFPDEFYPFTALAESLGSQFGLWIGPRGGYNKDTIKFAKHIQSAGNGYVNNQSKDICVASEKYIDKLTEFMLSCQKKFNLNYWKIDGFAQKPCKSTHHGHLTGGYRNMYFYTDVWEKWIDLFNKLYEKGGSNYWLNATSYAMPSPWLLQFANSVWIQTSTDVGFEGKKGVVSDKDRMLSYRDERYLEFYKDRQFQFPQSALYNHDPVYGNEAKVNMSDSEFRDYLFTMAMRGTAFWELYYSFNMMNDKKWRINYSVMRFLEDNMDILSKSIVFGGRPSKGQVYGYSCFDRFEGIVALRNSSESKQDFALCLNEAIGVSKELIYAKATQILPYKGSTLGDAYSYGDTVNITLAPYETRILHFGRRKKTLEAVYVTPINDKTAEVTFNQFINIESVTSDKKIIAVELLDDYMTALVTFEDSFERINDITLKNVCDIMDNGEDVSITFDYYDNFLVTEGLYGKGAFTIKATLDGEKPHILMKQGEEISFYVGDDGRVHLKMGYNHVISRSTVLDKVQACAVREKTGVIKLYLDGTLDGGLYCPLTTLSGEKAQVYNEGKVKLYNKAFAYDEI